MLGKILTISKNTATLELNKDGTEINDLINLHVVFEDQDKKILGEIDSINENTINVTFLGELTENDFIGGLIKKPSLINSQCNIFVIYFLRKPKCLRFLSVLVF